jgi:hypothetical protein
MSNQQNPTNNQGNTGNSAQKGSMPNDQNQQNRMNMPGNMHGGGMGFQPGMMNYGMPSFMSQLSGPMGNQQMPYGMFPGNPQMMNQGANPMKNQSPQDTQQKDNNRGGKEQDDIKGRMAKSEEPKDQSKLQGEAKNIKLDKKANSSEDDDGKYSRL